MMLKLLGLRRLFEQAEERRSSAKTAAAPSARLKPNPGTTILIVDDSKTTQLVLARMLAQQGYETLAAYDGESGLALARSNRPALILMDVVMPGMTGFQATRQLRRDGDAAVARIPVIIMSGNEQATEQFFSMKIGANDFMTKPFTADGVFRRIEKLLYPHAKEEVVERTQTA